MTARVAIYSRISEDHPNEGFSLAVQRARLRLLCASKAGWVIVGEHSDEGSSTGVKS